MRETVNVLGKVIPINVNQAVKRGRFKQKATATFQGIQFVGWGDDDYEAIKKLSEELQPVVWTAQRNETKAMREAWGTK